MKPALASAILAIATLGVVGVAAPPDAAAGDTRVTWLLTQTNGDTNRVIVYADRGGGPVEQVRKYPTGGAGTGGRLHNASAMAMDGMGRILSVDAGSNRVSILGFDHVTGAVSVVGSFASLGSVPSSIAVQGDLIYVLNSGMVDFSNPERRVGPAVIQGFRVHEDGRIRAIPRARLTLPGACVKYPCFGDSLPVQVGITPARDGVFVSDTGRNAMYSATLDGQGRPGAMRIQESPGAFGFSVAANGLIGLSAFPAEGDGYAVNGRVTNGRWSEVSERIYLPVPGACWTAWNPEVSRLYVASARAATGTTTTFVSTLRSNRSSQLSLSYDAAVPLPKVSWHPLDLAYTRHRLYNVVRNGVHVFDVRPDGDAVFRPELGAVSHYANGATGLLAITAD